AGAPSGWDRRVMTRVERRPALRRVMDVSATVRRVDGVLLVAVAALCVIGTLLVWSSTRTWAPGSTGLVKKHLLNLAIGVALMGGAMVMDRRRLRVYAPFVYLVSVIGLVLVVTPVGSTVNGSHSWILLG